MEMRSSSDPVRKQAVLQSFQNYLKAAGRRTSVVPLLPLLPDDLRLISEGDRVPSFIPFKRLSDQPLRRDLLTSASWTGMASQIREDAAGMEGNSDWIHALCSKHGVGVWSNGAEKKKSDEIMIIYIVLTTQLTSTLPGS